MKTQNSWIAMLTFCFFVIGLIVASQAVTRSEYLTSLETQSQENLVILWRGLNEKSVSLRAELFNLRQEQELLESQVFEDLTTMESIQNELRNIRKFNGDSDVQGEGLQVTIDASTPIIHLELLDLVNELWNSGAEAISINDIRFTSRTYIGQGVFSTDYFITVNSTPISYPIVVKAIGNSQNLQNGLTITGGVVDILNSYGVFPIVTTRETVMIPRSSDADFYRAFRN